MINLYSYTSLWLTYTVTSEVPMINLYSYKSLWLTYTVTSPYD